MSKPDQVVVAGHICLDIIPDLHSGSVQGAQFFIPGKLAEIGPAHLSTGGPVSNTGLALSLLGIPTQLMGKVGADLFGELMRLMLSRWKVDGALLVVPGESTSYTIVLNPPGFDRMFLHHPAANNTFCAGDIPYAAVAGASIFHLGYPPLMRRLYEDEGSELEEIYRRVKQLGVTTSLDMSLPDPRSPSGQANWRAILSRCLPYVDLFLPSAEEILFMLERNQYDQYLASGSSILAQVTGEDLSRLSSTLLDMGAKIVGIKCGERGFYLRTAGRQRLNELRTARPADLDGWADREAWEASFHVEHFAGATGSGDSAIAGFLAAYLYGCSFEQTLRAACAVGALNVTAPDALSGLKSWDETLALVKAGWQKNSLEVSSPGWQPGADLLWHGPFDRKAG